MAQDEIGKVAGKAIDEESRFCSYLSGKPLKGFKLEQCDLIYDSRRFLWLLCGELVLGLRDKGGKAVR